MGRYSEHSNHHSNNEHYSDLERRPKRLYKNPDKAKLCGVCAGLSEFFGLETWVVRLIAVSFLLFSGGTAVVAYFVACFILDPKPGSESNKGCFGHEKNRHRPSNAEDRQYNASVKDVWKKGAAPATTLKKVEDSFDHMEKKLQTMESYVTSNHYKLEKEFNKMA